MPSNDSGGALGWWQTDQVTLDDPQVLPKGRFRTSVTAQFHVFRTETSR